MSEADSYHDRTGRHEAQGSAIVVGTDGDVVTLELGVVRNFGSISTDASAALSTDEARELADDLYRAANEAEKPREIRHG